MTNNDDQLSSYTSWEWLGGLSFRGQADDAKRIRLPEANRLEFVVELEPTQTIGGLRIMVRQHMGGEADESGDLVRDNFVLEPLFNVTAEDDLARNLGLDNYYLLTVPLPETSIADVYRTNNGLMFELAHDLYHAIEMVQHVDPAVPYERFYGDLGELANLPSPPDGNYSETPFGADGIRFDQPFRDLLKEPSDSETPNSNQSGYSGFMFGSTDRDALQRDNTNSAARRDARDPDDKAWHLRAIKIPTKFTASGTEILDHNGGKGIVIGQVDTGTRSHFDLTDGTTSVYDERQWDAVNNDAIAKDEFKGIITRGHGGSTAAFLASRGNIDERPRQTTTDDMITGVANQANVIPVRATNWVGQIFSHHIARAIDYCCQNNVDVITISMGGFFLRGLESAIKRAVQKNIIVIAAGGQFTPIIPAPAHYPDCIAVTATNISDGKWFWATEGKEICIAAPGHEVWIPDIPYRLACTSSGTSFSTPTVAGVAAIWLKHHKDTGALGRYGSKCTLQEVFRYIIQKTAQRRENWNFDQWGAGIIDASAVLEFPLPSVDEVCPESIVRDAGTTSPTSYFAQLVDVLGLEPASVSREDFASSLRDGIRSRYADSVVLPSANDVEQYASELVTLVMTVDSANEFIRRKLTNQPELTNSFADSITEVAKVRKTVSKDMAAWLGLPAQ